MEEQAVLSYLRILSAYCSSKKTYHSTSFIKSEKKKERKSSDVFPIQAPLNIIPSVALVSQSC